MHLHPTNVSHEPKSILVKEQALQQMVLGKWDLCAKYEMDLYLMLYTKTNTKWIQCLNQLPYTI